MKDRHDVFVLSASTAGDDASQWRLYADGSRGYCVEVDACGRLAVYSDDKGVEDVEPPSSNSWGAKLGHITNVTPWQHVIYEEGEVSRVLGELTGWADLRMAQITDVDGAVCEDDTRLEDLEDEAWKGLTTIAHLVKSPGFSGEHEVRTVATFLVGDAHIRYRAGGNGIVGYTALTWDREGSGARVLRRSRVGETFVPQLPLRSIRIGALLPTDQEGSVRRFLRRQGMRDVKVMLSEVPLR